ncbi:MAG: serine/threonine protein kinase [Deltaproteobacteria bacterium]|nr:serine/threonine protein kinase [Deltaproteobacteria bacterium]
MGEPAAERVLDDTWRLVRIIGRGAMGVVWEGRRVADDRPVAVKLLRRELVEDEECRARFEREARAASRIGSPHIVEVLGWGGGTRSPFLVMELLEGRSFEAVLREEGALPADRAARILGQVLEGVGAAHAAGIIHRDLKPENVFLLARGPAPDFVKLLDFGVAKVLEGPGAARLTAEGGLLGTVPYLAPELIAGVSPGADHRVDLWAVGVILFRALTGRFPHTAPSQVDVTTAIVTRDAPAPSSVRAGLPAGLDAVLQCALHRNVRKRFGSAEEFGAALASFGGPSG